MSGSMALNYMSEKAFCSKNTTIVIKYYMLCKHTGSFKCVNLLN